MNTNVTNNNNEELVTDLRPILMESIRSGTTLKVCINMSDPSYFWLRISLFYNQNYQFFLEFFYT